MDTTELERIRAKKEPLKTEMRRFIEARLAEGNGIDDILKEVPHWDEALVKELFARIREQKKPERYYTSIREPLMTDRFE